MTTQLYLTQILTVLCLLQDGSKEESASSVNASSVKITDITQDGDTFIFAITSQTVRTRLHSKKKGVERNERDSNFFMSIF